MAKNDAVPRVTAGAQPSSATEQTQISACKNKQASLLPPSRDSLTVTALVEILTAMHGGIKSFSEKGWSFNSVESYTVSERGGGGGGYIYIYIYDDVRNNTQLNDT